MDTTCLTAVVLLLAAFSARSTGQTETTAPAVTTTPFPMTESSNDVPETSPEDSLLSIQGQMVLPSSADADNPSSDPTPEEGTTVFPNVDGSVVNSIATGFEKESDKLNELDADQSAKRVGPVVPENNAASTDGPSVKTPNNTTTTSPVASTSEVEATTRLEHDLGDSSAVLSTTEGSGGSTAEAVPTSSHVGDEATTSAPSSFPLATATVTSPEVKTGSYNAGVSTEPSVSSETTPAPHEAETTPFYGSFNTEQSPDTPFPLEPSSVFGDTVPHTGEPFTPTYSEPVRGSDSSSQAETTATEYAHDTTTGSFQGPETFTEPLGTSVPSYLYSTGPSTDAYSVFGADYGSTHDATAAERVTSEHTQQEPIDSTTLSPEVTSSEQGHTYDETGTPGQQSAQPELETTTESKSLSSAGTDDGNELPSDTETVPTEAPYTVDTITAVPTQSPGETDSTSAAQHDGTTQHNTSSNAEHIESQTELTSTAVSQQHVETTTNGDLAFSTTLQENAADVTTTESTMTEQSSNSSKMGRALETDSTTTDSSELIKEPVTATPEENSPTSATPSATDEPQKAESTPAPRSESFPSTTSESTTNAVSAYDHTTVAPSESISTSSNDVKVATTEATDVVSTDTVTIQTTASPDVAETTPEGATEAATMTTPSIPNLSTASQESATDSLGTMSSSTAGPDEGTTPAMSDTTAPEIKDETTTLSAREQSKSLATETTNESATGSTTSALVDISTQSATHSADSSTESSVIQSSESSTQSPDVAPEVQTGTEQASAATDITTSQPAETESTSSDSEATHGSTVATFAVTQEQTSEMPLQSRTDPTTQTTHGSSEVVDDTETTSLVATSVEPRTFATTEESPVSATEEAATPPPETTVYEATTAASLGFSITEEGQAETAATTGYVTKSDDASTEATSPVTTSESATGEIATTTGRETTISQEGETSVSGSEDTMPSASSGTTAATGESETTAEAEAVTPASSVTTSVVDEAMSTMVVETTTEAVRADTTTVSVEATTSSVDATTEQHTAAVSESGITGPSSGASRSPKQITYTTSMSTPEWTTAPSTEDDVKHSFTTASDLFSTTRLYTLRRQTTPFVAPEEHTTEQATTEGVQWSAGVTTSPEVQDWSSTTQRMVFTTGSTTGSETGSTIDDSCNIVEGSLPVSCLLPEELNHTVTVKFADLNRTRAETFRTEARVWLQDYCNKNDIPLSDPTVVFLNGEERGMDLISFFVMNRTRGSVVPSETVITVLNNMKLTFEDKLGTAITDVFYGLPVVQKKDVGVAGFLGSSLGLVYVIVGAALAALLLLALLVVIMVKCRTLSSQQYSPDSEKLTKDLHMRAEMGDLRPADEILKEEAQLKEGLNGNGTHINGDSWVVPYSQIVNERKSTTDAQDTRL